MTLASEGQAFAALVFAFVMLLPVLLFALAYWRRWDWLVWIGLIGNGVWATPAPGTHQQTRKHAAALSAGGGSANHGAQ